MLTVEVHTLENWEGAVEGTLSWDGEKVVCDPADSTLLRNLAADLPDGGDGAAFLEGLHRVYNGTYLRVSPPLKGEGDGKGGKGGGRPGLRSRLGRKP